MTCPVRRDGRESCTSAVVDSGRHRPAVVVRRDRLDPATARPSHAAQRSAPVVRSQLVWFDRAGKRIEPLGGLADHLGLELSPDGKQVAVAILDRTQGTHDLWLYEVPGGRRTRFTSGPEDENWLIWSPDGRRVIFNSFGADRLELRQSPSSEARTEAVLLDDAEGKWPVSWSPDGQFILVVKNSVGHEQRHVGSATCLAIGSRIRSCND